METPQNPAPRPCWSCGAFVDPGDRFCRNCGKGQGADVPWYYRHWGIILLALFGLGPFALIPIWRSPILSRNAKLAYTAALIAATAFVGWRVYQAWLFARSLLGV